MYSCNNIEAKEMMMSTIENIISTKPLSLLPASKLPSSLKRISSKQILADTASQSTTPPLPPTTAATSAESTTTQSESREPSLLIFDDGCSSVSSPPIELGCNENSFQRGTYSSANSLKSSVGTSHQEVTAQIIVPEEEEAFTAERAADREAATTAVESREEQNVDQEDAFNSSAVMMFDLINDRDGVHNLLDRHSDVDDFEGSTHSILNGVTTASNYSSTASVTNVSTACTIHSNGHSIHSAPANSTSNHNHNSLAARAKKKMKWHGRRRFTNISGHAHNAPTRYVARQHVTDAVRRKAWLEYSCADIAMNEREGEYFDLVEKAARYNCDSNRGTYLYAASSNSSTSARRHRRARETSDWMGTLDKDIRRTFPKHSLFRDQHPPPAEDDDFGAVDENSNGHRGNRGTASPNSSNGSSADDPATGGIAAVAKNNIDSFFYLGEVARFSVESGGQASLRRLLHAYSIYDPQVGYCQGMNFIAAMFLTVLNDEEESFWMMVSVMNEEPYNLRSMFQRDMAGTQEALYVAERAIKRFLPELARHFEGENVNVSMFLIPWLMTVFTRNFPFDLVLRVWDAFLFEGWCVVYRTMLALLADIQDDLLELPFEGILGYLGEFTSKVDGKKVMASSYKMPMKHKHLFKYQKEWRALSRKGGPDTRVVMKDTVKRVCRNIIK
mmetsp:Transcript_7652/g.14446  ORF Transcript_7652/g.14446 Transcript_7652/m.14446 type:complete len:673 (-) Transcript_7652:132-2150(-)